jgi:hypothetical protein
LRIVPIDHKNFPARVPLPSRWRDKARINSQRPLNQVLVSPLNCHRPVIKDIDNLTLRETKYIASVVPVPFLVFEQHPLGFELLQSIIDWHPGSPSDVPAVVNGIVTGILGQKCPKNWPTFDLIWQVAQA